VPQNRTRRCGSPSFLLCEQVGVALGIAVETLIDKLFKEWKYSFLVQSGMLILFVVIPMLFIPERNFRYQGDQDLTRVSNEGSNKDGLRLTQKRVTAAGSFVSTLHT